MKPIVIYGSSSPSGFTKETLDQVLKGKEYTFVDLNTKNISYYDYEHKNKDDDFISIANQMLAHEVIVFVTPVYWYTLSAQLKVFFDRLTDLITIHKPIGRSLKGKRVFLISTGWSKEYPQSLEYPVKNTAEYFEMNYGGILYFSSGSEKPSPSEQDIIIQQFQEKIFSV